MIELLHKIKNNTGIFCVNNIIQYDINTSFKAADTFVYPFVV